MKIGINASFLRKPGTGIGQVTTHFLRELFTMSESGELADMEFVLYLEEDVDLALPENFTKHISLPPYKRDDLIRKIWWEKYVLPQQVTKDGCDVFLSLYQCPTVVKNKNIRHVMLVHDIIPKIFPRYLGNTRKKLYQKLTDKGILSVDHIVTVSEHTKKDLLQHFTLSANKITSAYISVDPIFQQEITEEESQRVLSQYNLTKGYIYIGGGLEVRKNVENSIRAYAVLMEECEKQTKNPLQSPFVKGGGGTHKQNKREQVARPPQSSFAKEDRDIPSLCKGTCLDLARQGGEVREGFKMPDLVISGKFVPELVPMVTDVENLAKELDISEHVKLLGFVDQKDLPALYKNALCFLFPSQYEGFGMPVLEAMTVGTAVITTKNASLPEVGGDAVLYCADESMTSIADALQKLMTDDVSRQELASKGAHRATMFTWQSFTQSVLSLIRT